MSAGKRRVRALKKIEVVRSSKLKPFGRGDPVVNVDGPPGKLPI